MWFLFFLCWTPSTAMSMGLPDYMKACSRNDPNLNDCAFKSAKESIHQFSLGDQERGLPALDPLYVPQMIIYVPNKNGFKIIFKHNYFTGLSNLHVESLKFDLDKKIILTNVLVNLDVKNTYELSGRFLSAPITSSGDSSLKLENVMLHITLWYEHVKDADDKIYWKIYNQDIKYEVEKATFRLENLLSDKKLGDTVNRLLNELWREIVAEVGPTITSSITSAVVDNVGVLLSQVPYEELMPE